MAYGYEIHFGYVGIDACNAFLARTGITVVNNEWYGKGDKDTLSFINQDHSDSLDQDSPIFLDISARVKEAWDTAMAEMGWPFKLENANAYGMNTLDYMEAKTVYGYRTCRKFSIDIDYDPDEMGHTLGEDVTIGVQLSGRYFPVFVDMSDSHGTVSLHHMAHPEYQNLINVAVRNIVAKVPELSDAVVFFKEIHY